VLRYQTDPANRDRTKLWRMRAQIKKAWGMTVEEYKAFLASHGNRCGVCQSTEKLGIDHDHETGRKRGVLCKRCNMALGYIKDDIRKAYGLVDYISKRCSQ
jgi:hypothetical protein